jgi:hypothetical protein
MTNVFAPHGIDEFFAQYFEREPMLVERGEPAYFQDVYSVSAVEDALVAGSREPANFALVKAGAEEIAPHAFTARRMPARWRETGRPAEIHVDARAVLAFFERGYTLVVKDAGRFHAPLQRCCTELQRDLDGYVLANAYFTPPRSQGFAPHHDTHDTLTIQLDGEKRWRIYEPLVRLPKETQPFPSGAKVAGLQPRRDVTLRPGDTLYIPRGFPHEALTSEQRSLHVTFALVPVRAVDVLEMLLRIAADGDVELRRACARGWADDPQFARHVQERLLPAFVAACTPQRIALAREVLLKDTVALARADVRGAFDRVRTPLDPNAFVRFRRDIPLSVRAGESAVEIIAPGRALAFSLALREAIERLSVDGAPANELDPELVRTLFLEGLVEEEMR